MARPPDLPEDLGGLRQCVHCMGLKRPAEFNIHRPGRPKNHCKDCEPAPPMHQAPRFTQASLAAWAGFGDPGDSDRMTP
jgi:hypothetical protein